MQKDDLLEVLRSLPELESSEPSEAGFGPSRLGRTESSIGPLVAEITSVRKKLGSQQGRELRKFSVMIEDLAAQHKGAMEQLRRERERSLAAERQRTALARCIVVMVDTLTRMNDAMEASPQLHRFAEQTSRTIDVMARDAVKGGVTKLGRSGEPFDPDLHQLADGASTLQGDVVVDKVSRPGFSLDGTVLERAIVSIALA